MLKLFRNGAALRVSSFTLVGFIDLLDGKHCIQSKPSNTTTTN
jgi:hypothetical protein